MGRIKKVATERHTATLSPFVKNFVDTAVKTPLHQLPAFLDSFPQHWPLPRGDLYHWIPLLDRFDHIYELFNKEYGLNEGPQTQPFGRRLLQRSDAADGVDYPSATANQEELDASGYSLDGDRELVEAIVGFSRLLLEHCGNRSLYDSSSHINDLLHTTSLSLLRACLKLSLRLAQRYQVARYKSHHQSAQASLLANHYNLTLDNVLKIAQPFPKPVPYVEASVQTPSKGKEKAHTSSSINTVDLVSLVKSPLSPQAKSEMSTVSLSFYRSTPAAPSFANVDSADVVPATPTPVRRSSALGPSRDHPSPVERSVSTNDVGQGKGREVESLPASAPKLLQLSPKTVAETPSWALLRDNLQDIPVDLRYDLLHRVRVAKAFASSNSEVMHLLEIRLLAVANLAYVYPDSKFQEKLGSADSEEPRRFHLAQQLCDLLQPASSAQVALPLSAETTVLLAIEALSRTKHKISEVADALAITVNHGMLYYELRKVIASLHAHDHADGKKELEETEWRDATFDLVNSLLQSGAQSRYGERMVTAGIIGILVEALELRTPRAERFNEKVLQFFDSFIHGVSSALQMLANFRGLDIIADLTSYEVQSSLADVREGRGLPDDHKSKVVDYAIPYFKQATLRQLFKNTAHMFDHHTGSQDRLLRNLIDTPQTLGALRQVIENAEVFGSNVWNGAVNIINQFINHEPTMYQVIGEAGLTKSFLDSITGQRTSATDGSNIPGTTNPSILPVGEVMCDIPNVFGAICLNESGMQLFQTSGALVKYFDIFSSPVHVRAMEEDGQTASAIGSSFDELARHQPRLKPQILSAVQKTLERLRDLLSTIATAQHAGAKLWEHAGDMNRISGGRSALSGSQGSTEHAGNTEPASSEEVPDDGSEGDKERAPGMFFLTAAFKFLDGFFHNSAMCAAFCEEAGIELVLDLILSPCNPYDLFSFPAFMKIHQVMRTLCDAKPHLVLPSILHRTQRAVSKLGSLSGVAAARSSFANFISLSEDQTTQPLALDGTTTVKALSEVFVLSQILSRCISPPYTVRHGNSQNQHFANLNFTDVYVTLIEELSKISATCAWEEILLAQVLPENVRLASKPRYYSLRTLKSDGTVEPFMADKADEASQTGGRGASSLRGRDLDLAVKNARTIRYLLEQVPKGVFSLFHYIGQAIVLKRREPAVKQHASYVAETLAKSVIWALDYCRSDDAHLVQTYLANLLKLLGELFVRKSINMENMGSDEILTLLLSKFYQAGGFDKLNSYLELFISVLPKDNGEDKASGDQRDESHGREARQALQYILALYSPIVRAKCLASSQQTGYISVPDKLSPEFFTLPQFIVELRNAILPALSKIWNSPDLEKCGHGSTKELIDILRVILKGDGEERAVRRSERAFRYKSSARPAFRLSAGGDEMRLRDLGFDKALSREALYRCNNHNTHAEQYCRLRQAHPNIPRFPIPDAGQPSEARDTEDKETEDNSSVDMDVSDDENAQTHVQAVPEIPADSDMSDDGADFGSLGALPQHLQQEDLSAMITNGSVRAMLEGLGQRRESRKSGYAKEKTPFVTVDDLNDKRAELRSNLIDRCLEILSSQPTITFELADLIQAAVPKSGEGAERRADIAVTLVTSLLSLQAEEANKESGVKIHAYAHLVALILQDREFFQSALAHLSDYLESLITWLRLDAEQKAEDAPWIDMILLIIERVLAEDEQPQLTEFKAPPAEDPLKPLSPLPERTMVVPMDTREQIFTAILDLLPKVGKNTSLALSLSRVLVILTRNRKLALQLSEKHNIGRLFLMVRQLAGQMDEKIYSSVLLLLRHMIEDDSIIRQIMRTEIRLTFETLRSGKQIDTNAYVKQFYHLVLRDPAMFAEVTAELLEIPRYHVSGHKENAPQYLALKRGPPVTSGDQAEGATAGTNSTVSSAATHGQKSSETKPVLAETTDGVVQFLLRELSNYKDVEDKSFPDPFVNKASTSTSRPATGSSDVEMADSTGANTTSPLAGGSATSTDGREIDNKQADSTIFNYRRFILQCLAEIVSSYNRTKVEFINFSRKSETQPSTPSKPRAGTLNYLLNVLLPVGTLEHRDDDAHMKRVFISNWATNVLVALCTKTPERHSSNPYRTTYDITQEEPELTFVRKFVLEHALRAFKEATSSTEPLDVRYSRLFALGELFHRILSGKAEMQRSPHNQSSQQQVGKMMYEKNFIGCLTSAIAELDLNFPNAKRAVKYILAPLKQLTELGVAMSQNPDINLSGPLTDATTDADEISSATSLSDNDTDDDDEREQTPDLFRGSSLGMFESGGAEADDDSDEESEDENDDEMYDDGFEEEMEYDEEPMAEHGDVVSDEDDDEMGPIEGVPGDVEMDVEMMMREDDDDSADDDEDDSDEDDDDDDEDEDDEDDDEEEDGFDEAMDEITADDENASLEDDDEEGEWEDDELDYGDHDRVVIEHDPAALEHIANVIDPSGDLMDEGMLPLDLGGDDEEFFEDEMPPGDDEEDDDDEDEGDMDNEIAYEPEVDEDDEEEHGAGWHGRWGGPPPPHILLRGFPQGHHPRDAEQMLNMLDQFRTPGFRSHRPFPARDEDGTNPLLQRNGGQPRRDFMEVPLSGRGTGGRRTIIARAGQHPFQEILDAVAPGSAEGTFMSVNVGPGALPHIGGFPAMIFQGRSGQPVIEFDSTRPLQDSGWLSFGQSRGSTDELQTGEFRSGLTAVRWQEEARMLFAADSQEKSSRILGLVLRLLVPPAMEAKRIKDEQDRVAREKAEESRREKAAMLEAERKAAEEAREKEEEAARARQAALQEEEARDGNGQESATESAPQSAVPVDQDASEAAPPAVRERVTITMRGRELDITDLGIDLDYLLALPEEFREDVVAQQVQQRNSRAARASGQASGIAQDFLDALPPDLQQEILRNEESQRRAAQRAANQSRASAPRPAEDSAPADFMAALAPDLRHSILMDADDTMLAALPEELQAEARLIIGGRYRRADAPGRPGRAFGIDGAPVPRSQGAEDEREASGRPVAKQRRPVAQMLDKSGIATLLRLMFVSLNHKVKSNLHSILASICKNTQNRAEVISILLSILQDGTADVGAVERSFAHLSLRAKQATGGPKTPQTLKRTQSGQPAIVPATELSPLNIVQQCLGTLRALANDNPRVSSFFLSEHETTASQKIKTPMKRNKSRDYRAARFPLNALLTLLDRPLITENTMVMENLAALLSHVTHPLMMLLRRAKDSQPVQGREMQDSTDQGGQSANPDPRDVSMSDAPAHSADGTGDAPAVQTTDDSVTKKKHRELSPPDVPDENIRLVVNILAARECPSKTFSDTLDIIKNLSAIPGAKEIFGRELIRQAQELGDMLVVDLGGLTEQIQTAATDADLQGIALANFASAGSKQRKMLRVLVALDHLFDPKRMPAASTTTGADLSQNQKLKEDIVASFYQTSTFQKLWESLSNCLAEIRNRGNLVNVATILLPLIESLMVVCRNSTWRNQNSGESSDVANHVDELLFSFTEEHRKILNELIRNNPKLMKGNLSVLAKNSKILEFDNKQTYFKSKLHDRRAEIRMSQPSLPLNVRRNDVFLDSFKALYYKTGDEIKYGKLNIRFLNEEGVDAGGVSREWFTAMARQMFLADYALFNSVASDRTTFHPNALSEINPEHLVFFKFVGRIIGKALYEGRHLDAHFSRAVYRRILGKSVSLKDMESLDLDYYKSLVWILENDITDVTFETFSYDMERFGVTETVDLIEDGRNVPVTQENKQEYVRLVVEYRLIKSVEQQLNHFLEGFYEIVPADLISIFNEQELELLISGLPTIDVDDWRNNTEYHNYQANSPQILWFWRAVLSFDQEERAKLLQFVTGTSKVPLAGFKELEGMNGFARFNIHRDYSSKEKLPSSHTCFNQLDLPEYESYEHLRQQLYTAITTGSEYFGFA